MSRTADPTDELEDMETVLHNGRPAKEEEVVAMVGSALEVEGPKALLSTLLRPQWIRRSTLEHLA